MTTSSSTPSAFTLGAIHPAPTAEETAAIVAALEMSWPRAVVQSASSQTNTAWRFSGRWWAAPLAVSRARPQR